MAKKLSGLGRGLESVFLENTIETNEEKAGGVLKLRVSQLEPKDNQPRKHFDTEALAQLADSIAAHGVLQPILVREILGDRYQIIAGERRWRAAKMAGLSEVPVVLLAQLNRGPETRQDHTPMIADLRESGSIEQDADMVILLYRPAVYDETEDNTSQAIIAKHRHGPTGTVMLAWQGEYTRFMNLAQESNY